MNTMQRSRHPWPFDGRVLRHAALAAALAGAFASVRAEGQVDVAFVNAAAFADAGFSSHQRDANLKVLSDYLVAMGARHVATGQTLKIEVLDLSLAGTAKPQLGSGDVRIVKGGADWPRITLRYSLVAADGQVLQRGEDVLTDLDYTSRFGTRSETGRLPYEKRLLSNWLNARFPALEPAKI